MAIRDGTLVPDFDHLPMMWWCGVATRLTDAPEKTMPTINKRTRYGTQILEFIREYIADNRFAPSVRDIQLGCQINSPSVVDFHLEKLVQDGAIKRWATSPVALPWWLELSESADFHRR